MSEAPAPINVAVLDRLRAAMNGSGVDLVGELIDMFVVEGPDALDGLRRSAAAGDLEPIASRAHDLKGSSANLGAERLVELCHQIERSAREADLEAARAHLPGLEAELQRVLAALDDLR